MARDIEDRLRQSLQARAQDVNPDPAMYREVQSRIRRGRIVRWSFAGAGAVAVVAVAALVVPSVLDRRIEFEPGPVATQPPSEEHANEQAVPPCSDDGEALVAVVAHRDDGLHAVCSSGVQEPLTQTRSTYDGVALSPALSPDARLLAYAVNEDHEVPTRVVVFDLVDNEQVETIENASSPAYSSGGNLAFIRDEPGDGEQPRLVVREGDRTNESAMAPDIPEEFTARHLVWSESPDPRILYWEAQYEGTTVWGDDYIEPEAWRFDVTGDGNYAAPSSREDGELHLLRSCCVEVEGDTADTVELGALTLPDTQASFKPIVQLPEDFDARGLLTLAAAGTADIDQTTGSWRSGAAPAWLVGDGDRLYLLDEDGNTDLVTRDITGVAFNPAVQLPPSEDAGSEEPREVAQVDVFFTEEGSACGDSVTAYPRSVEGPGVLRGVLEHLLAGPTDEEIAEGAQSIFSDKTAGSLNSVTITDDGLARVDFADFSAHAPGVACVAMALGAQLDATVKQFPTVKEVVYSFDGDIGAFYGAYELSTPPHRPHIPLAVTQMQERISYAVMRAEQGDWDPLAELIDRETFSCSFSDQNEDCIALWQQQEAEGQDPLGPLEEILRGEPAKVDGAPIWAWPTEFVESDEYLGPRTGIQRNGTWRYYQQGGD